MTPMRLTALVAIIIAAAIASASAPSSAAAPTPTGEAASASTMGDVNCDTAVSSVDALTLLRAGAGIPADADCIDPAGDTDCDGDTDSVDALRILRHLAGLQNSAAAGCAPIGGPIGEPPTSEELIAEARESGHIDYETSLIFRAYALYNDPRLPEDYRSPVVDLHAGGDLFREIDSKESELSAETLDSLAPFTARPNDPESIFNASQPSGLSPAGAPTWVSMPAAGGAARVWVQDGPDAADALAQYAALVTDVWDPVTELMRPPIPDQAGTPSVDVNPDAAIDLYFVNVGDLDPRMRCKVNPAPCKFDQRMGGYTKARLPVASGASSASILIDRNVEGDLLVSHIAHEIFHTMQFAYDYAEGAWLMDATASWASFRVLSDLGYSRDPVHDYLPEFYRGLEQTLTRNEGLNRYASWLYFLFAEMERGPDVVKKIFERAAAPGEQNEVAVDLEMPFLDNFHKFALRNWNDEPVTPLYASADPTFPIIFVEPHNGIEPVTLDHGTYHLAANVQPLATHYFHYVFQDQSVQSLVFRNPLAASNIRLQAIKRIGDEWQAPEDWTQKLASTICRNIPEEQITELVIIITNSSLATPYNPADSPSLDPRPEGCSSWVGTATAEIDYLGRIFSTEVSGLRFDLDDDQDPTGRYVFYTLTESPVVNWTASGVDNFGCTVSGKMQLQPADGTIGEGRPFGILQIDTWENDYHMIINGADTDAVFTLNCPVGGVSEMPFPGYPIVYTGLLSPMILEGPVLQGEYFDSDSFSQRHWTWRFDPVAGGP